MPGRLGRFHTNTSALQQEQYWTLNSCWQLKLVFVNGTETVGEGVGKQLATNRTCLYSRKLFYHIFELVNSYLALSDV